jgi:endonuclease/exonuclease/phosphatase family metal-dependent hydrolase
MKIILERMSPILEQGIPVMLMGDLNCRPDSEPIRFLRNNGFGEDPEKGRLYNGYEKTNQDAPGTFNGFGKAKGLHAIDYIFVSYNITVLSMMVDKSHYGGGYPSDHYPVIADIIM